MPAALGNASFLYIFHRTLHATEMIHASNFHRHIAYKCVDVDIGFSVLINYGTQHNKSPFSSRSTLIMPSCNGPDYAQVILQ